MTKALIFPFLVVFLPQLALATVNHGVMVLAPLFTAAAKLPPEAVGLIGGLGGLGSVWCFASNSVILPSLGPMRALIFGCLLASTAVLAFTFAQAWLICLAAPLVGFGYAITAPAGSQLLARHTPKERWGTLFSLRMAAVPAGGAIAGIIGSGIAATYDWRLALVAILLPSLLCAGFLAVARHHLPDLPPKSRFRPLQIFNPALVISPFRVLRRIPGLGLMTMSSIGFAAVQGAVFTFLTTYLTHVIGLSILLAGGLYSSMQLASFAGRIGIGFLADWVGSTHLVLAILGFCSALAVVLLMLMSQAMPVALLFLMAMLVGVSIATWNGLFLAEISRVGADHDVSEATAASTFFTFVSYMLSPPLFGLVVLKAGYDVAFGLIGSVVLIAAIGLLVARRHSDLAK